MSLVLRSNVALRFVDAIHELHLRARGYWHFGLCAVGIGMILVGCGESDDENPLGLPDYGAIKPTGRTREFTLVAKPATHELADGTTVEVYAYNGEVPGPVLRVTEGDLVRVTLKNELPEKTSIHWHGLHIPYQQDGSAPTNQPPVLPGETHVYEFLASHAGTFIYHPHAGSEAEQVDKGLYGAFIIDPQVPDGQPTFDKEYILTLNAWSLMGGGMDMGGGHMANYDTWSINGKLFPETERIEVRKGERVRIRFINTSSSDSHPMHLHGHDMTVIAQDGEPLRTPYRLNTLNIAPFQTFDVAFVADNPGVWMFHCHELHHQESGMATLVVYEGFDPGNVTGGGGHGGH